MRSIIRIECEDGFGLFTGDSKSKSVYDFANDVGFRHKEFNTPYKDGLDTKKMEKYGIVLINLWVNYINGYIKMNFN